MGEPVADWTVTIDADTSDLRRQLGDAQKQGGQFAAALGSAFQGLALQGKGLGDVLRGLALNLSRLALGAAFRPLEQLLGNAFSTLLPGGPFAGPPQAAQAGMIVPFAKGGVVASPVAFPLGDGRTGMAGERGAEAILPLARGSDGRVGVRAEMSGAINVVFNVTAADAASFQRAESEIAAMLSRTVGRGSRNL